MIQLITKLNCGGFFVLGMIALLDKYNLKATFNLVSGYLGITSKRQTRNGKVDYPFVKLTEIREV